MKQNNPSSIWLLVFAYVFMIAGLWTYRKTTMPVVATPEIQQPVPDTLYVTGTVYSSTMSQTKKYIITASGTFVRNDTSMSSRRIISLSQDIVADNGYHFGDSLMVISSHPMLDGWWIYEDCMHYDQVNRCDFLVSRQNIKKFKQGVYDIKILR
jgi:hypothetical protein